MMIYRLTGSAVLLGVTALASQAPQLVIGPFAGILVGLSSEAFCFAVNSLSYLPLIFALTRARVEPNPRSQGAFAAVFREGIAYALSSYPIRSLLGLIAVLNFTASSYVVLMPVFARDVFHGGATTLGWLLGAAGPGSISAAIYLATRHSVVGLVKSIVIGASLAATALLLFSLTRRLAFALLAGAGVFAMRLGELRGRLGTLVASLPL